MFASLSPEVRAPQIMRDLGVSGAFIAALCRIEESKLSKALRQLKPLTNEEGKRLIETLNRLTELQGAVAPLTVDLRNPQNARLLLDGFDGMDGDMIRERVSALFQ